MLYVTYWGATEALGQSLVLPSVVRLAQGGARITLVTFDKREDFASRDEFARILGELERAGIRWIALRYHKRPQLPAKLYDVLRACVTGIATQLRGSTAIVHARTFVGGLAGLVLAPLLRAKLIYHNEGFYPDEQVDGGVWAFGSRSHRIARALEDRLYARADGIVALSERAKVAIEARPAVQQRRTPVIVVPSTVDLDRFQPRNGRSERHHSGLGLVYIGSIGLRYLFDRVAHFAAVAYRETGDARLHVLSRADRSMIEALLESSGLPRESWHVSSVPHAEMPNALVQHDAGLFFLTQGLSEHGCSPTKIGEYWACGLPVVTTPNVSDTDEIVRRERVGVIVREHSAGGYREAVRELVELLKDPEVGMRCRRAAESHYALGPGCERQIALYRKVLT